MPQACGNHTATLSNTSLVVLMQARFVIECLAIAGDAYHKPGAVSPNAMLVRALGSNLAAPVTTDRMPLHLAQDQSGRSGADWPKAVSLLLVSQVYNVSVSPFFGVQAPGPSPKMYGDLGINFSCSPANTHHLIDAAVGEVQRLQVRHPTGIVDIMRTL